MPTKSLDRLFVASLMPVKFDDYSVHIVNNTPVHYGRVVTLTGMFASVDEALLESTRARQDRGELRPYSALRIEDGDCRELDYVVWYHLDLIPTDTSRPPERVSFQFGGFSFGMRGATVPLPVLNCHGWPIDLEPRQAASDP